MIRGRGPLRFLQLWDGRLPRESMVRGRRHWRHRGKQALASVPTHWTVAARPDARTSGSGRPHRRRIAWQYPSDVGIELLHRALNRRSRISFDMGYSAVLLARGLCRGLETL